MFIINYFYDVYNYLFQSNDVESHNDIDYDEIVHVKSFTIDDINKVQLKSVKDRQLNKPLYNKVSLQNLNNNQLKDILNVKLNKTQITQKSEIYEPRHPVLRELLEKIKKNNN